MGSMEVESVFHSQTQQQQRPVAIARTGNAPDLPVSVMLVGSWPPIRNVHFVQMGITSPLMGHVMVSDRV